jgi:hypothetical protein
MTTVPPASKCQAATPTKACLILRPVGHLELHLADTMTAEGDVTLFC